MRCFTLNAAWLCWVPKPCSAATASDVQTAHTHIHGLGVHFQLADTLQRALVRNERVRKAGADAAQNRAVTQISLKPRYGKLLGHVLHDRVCDTCKDDPIADVCALAGRETQKAWRFPTEARHTAVKSEAAPACSTTLQTSRTKVALAVFEIDGVHFVGHGG